MLQGHKDLGSLSMGLTRAPWTDGSSVLVLSTDFSPTGNLLASGSADLQVRVCKSRYSPAIGHDLLTLSISGKYTTIS